MRKIYKGSLLLLAMVVLLFLQGSTISRGYDALLMVGELAGYSPPALLQTGSATTVATLCISNESRHYSADLYLPEDSPKAGIVLLHGAAETGKDDARLIAFARNLAEQRFAVLVPELPGPKALRVRVEDAQTAIDAFHFLNRYPGLENRVGFGGISVSAGLAFHAALSPEISDKVAFVFSIGGYYDLLRTINYSITGDFQIDGEWHHRTPNNYGKWLFVLSNLDVLKYRTDRIVLRHIAYRRMQAPEADISDMQPLLSTEGLAVLEYVTETDSQQLDARYAALPKAMRQHLESLDLANMDLSRLKAKVLLVHGYADPIIPHSESIALARALPPDQVELFLVHGLEHVDSRVQRLEDACQFWRASYALLNQRDQGVK